MNKPIRKMTPDRERMLDELDKKLIKGELTEEEWKEELLRIFDHKN